jgi:hypothetical protein
MTAGADRSLITSTLAGFALVVAADVVLAQLPGTRIPGGLTISAEMRS